MSILIYTDGSCKKNPGLGGYAAIVIIEGQYYPVSGHEENTTNNRMEMIAALKALEFVQKIRGDDWIKDDIFLYSDSNYLITGCTDWMRGWIKSNWKHNTLKNRDLWKQFAPYVLSENKIRFGWIRGHDGDQLNEWVDKLARRAWEAVSPSKRKRRKR